MSHQQCCFSAFGVDESCLACRPDQIKPELHRFLQMLKVVYDTFGLHYKMALSTRPQEKLGDDAMWDQAEGALQGALDETGLDWEVSHIPTWHANELLPLLNTSENVCMQYRCVKRSSNQKLHHSSLVILQTDRRPLGSMVVLPVWQR